MWEGYSVVNLNFSAFMKRRTVQPNGAARGPHLCGQSCNQPATQLSWGDEYKRALAPLSLLAKQI